MTQKEMILQHLKRHGSITPKDAIDNYGIMRLGARIYDLKGEGYKIVTETECGINRFGRPIAYARYFLRI